MHGEVEKFISYYYPDHKEYENMNKGKPTWRMTPKKGWNSSKIQNSRLV